MKDLSDAGPVTQPVAQARMRYIDTLRGVAALLVVWLHAASIFGRTSATTERSGGWLYSTIADIDVGHIGVVVFFLISGFVIPFSISPDRAGSVGAFAIRRFFRIYPAYWLSVPLAALAIFWVWGSPFSLREILVNLTLLQDLFGVRSAEGVYWTLPVELTFYALCIVLLKTNSLFDMRRVALLAAALGLSFAVIMATYWLRKKTVTTAAPYWLLNLSVMLCGALFRNRWHSQSRARDSVVDVLFWAMLASYIVVLPVCAVLATGASQNVPLTYAIGFLIFIVGTRWLRIETRATDWLGTISYSIYLFHSIVFLAMEWWLLRHAADSSWRTQHLAVYMAAGLAAVLIVASLVYWFVEKPGIAMGHRLATSWRNRAARARSIVVAA